MPMSGEILLPSWTRWGLYNWGQIVAGSVQTAAGLVQSTAGTVEVLAGIVGTPETGGVSLVAIAPGLANVGVGGLAIKDGTSLITQGITGEKTKVPCSATLVIISVERPGQIIGNIINAAIGVKSCGAWGRCTGSDRRGQPAL